MRGKKISQINEKKESFLLRPLNHLKPEKM